MKSFVSRAFIEPLENRIAPAAVVGLSDLNGFNGFRLSGSAAGDQAGLSVSDAGDLNGDGFEDLILSAPSASTHGGARSGSVYVLFGKIGSEGSAEHFPPDINLSALDGSNGFQLDGLTPNEILGTAVSAAGDINGDGLDDLLIGAPGTSKVYVVFGTKNSPGPRFDLSALNGANGFVISGTGNDAMGLSVSAAGDVNGDGLADIIVGAPDNFTNSAFDAAAYVVFGKSTFNATFNVAVLDGRNGFKVSSNIAAHEYAGMFVSGNGDFNGDGFDEVVVSTNKGAAYVIYGNAKPIGANINIASLPNGLGFKVIDPDSSTSAPRVSFGDINRGGFEDLIVGGKSSSFVLFGRLLALSSVNLSTLTGSNGFRINSTGAVSTAGDVNGDGFDDFIIGATGTNGTPSVVFGKFNPGPLFDINTIDGQNGFHIVGQASGSAVSAGGDVNGDGFDDIIVGAPFASPNGLSTGAAYVVFGFNTGAVTRLGTAGNDILTGTELPDVMVGGQGADVLHGILGADLLRGGQGDDVLDIATDSSVGRIVGGRGFDTLRISSPGLLMLPSISDVRISGIECIDLTYPGSNQLVLNAHEVLNLSGESNTLMVKGTKGDAVEIGTGWLRLRDETVGKDLFKVYTQGLAVLEVASDVQVTPITGVDLSISVEDTNNDDKAAPGDTMIYTVSYSNRGSTAATGVVVTEHVPAGTSFDAAHSSAGWTETGPGVYQLTVGSLSLGQARTAQFAVIVNATAPSGVNEIVNNVTMSDSGDHGPDLKASDNTAVDRDVLGAAPNLTITVDDGATTVTPGSHVVYTLNYSNIGNQDATGVELIEILPDGSVFDPDASTPGWTESPLYGGFIMAIGNLAGGGGGGTATFAVRLSSPASAGANFFSDVVFVQDDGLNGRDLDLQDNGGIDTDDIDAAPDLKVELKTDVSGVFAGGTVTYFLNYANVGNQDANGIILTETLPDGMSFDAGASSGWEEVSPGFYAITLSALGSGESGTLRLVAHVPASPQAGLTDFHSFATMSYNGEDGTDPTPENNADESEIPLLIHPTISANGRHATFTDVDGDIVTVTFTGARIDVPHQFFANLRLAVEGDGARLEALEVLSSFAKTSLSIKAVTPPGGLGDGRVDVGAIFARGLDLGAVTVDGDLGRIEVGDGVLETPALKRLDVQSFGALGADTQPWRTMDALHSKVRGKLGKLNVARVMAAELDVQFGSLGEALIGGLEGRLTDGAAGLIHTDGDIGEVTIKDSIFGGHGRTGIMAGGKLGTVRIAGQVTSDDGSSPIVISAFEGIGSVKVGGDLTRAQILAGYTTGLEARNADASIGNVTVNGSWTASSLAAGVADITGDGFGRNDALIPGGRADLIAAIASVTIKQRAYGTPIDGDFFGITAESVGRLRIYGVPQELTADNDLLALDYANNDFHLVEL